MKQFTWWPPYDLLKSIEDGVMTVSLEKMNVLTRRAIYGQRSGG